MNNTRREYAPPDGRVLLSADEGYFCEIENAERSCPDDIGILTPYTTRKVVESLYRLGAMTAEAIR